MQVVNKFTMFNMTVKDMPKAKEFYADKLGLTVVTDYRQNDDNWWVSLTLPEGGATITLARVSNHEPVKPGAISIYFATSDIAAAHKDLSDKGVKVNKIGDDLYGPGSGVKWFNLEDPDGNLVHLAQA
jgi:catechol 2,3-dioxygenase-like lactoylglutathione lyase family enzyme